MCPAGRGTNAKGFAGHALDRTRRILRTRLLPLPPPGVCPVLRALRPHAGVRAAAAPLVGPPRPAAAAARRFGDRPAPAARALGAGAAAAHGAPPLLRFRRRGVPARLLFAEGHSRPPPPPPLRNHDPRL